MIDSPYVLAGIVIAILAIAGSIAITIVRSRAKTPEPAEDLWARLVTTDDGPMPVQDRLDMVARLEMVGEKWCIDALHSATHEEEDPEVNAAIHDALTRLSS